MSLIVGDIFGITMRYRWAKRVAVGAACVLGMGLVLMLLLNAGVVRWKLRVATGPTMEGGPAFLTAVTEVIAEERPHVQLQRIQTESMEASAKALEKGEADLAIVRSDIAMPNNGLTIAVFRRDNLVLIVPAHSRISSLQGLAGKAVGLLKGALPEQDQSLGHLLDAILHFYNITPQSVTREFLSLNEVGTAFKKKEIDGILALGPTGPGPIANAISAITHATKAPPKLVGEKQAEAIAKTIPGAESNEIEEGAFGGASPRPEEVLVTLAVTYRLVGRHSLPDFVAGEMARMLWLAKARILSTSPLAMHIEAPDSEDGTGLPIHPGAAAFFNGEQSSLLDSATNIFFLASIIFGFLGTSIAWFMDAWRRTSYKKAQLDIDRLISIMHEGRNADMETLEQLEDAIDGIVSRSLVLKGGRTLDSDQLNILSIAIHEARSALEKRRNAIRKLKV